MSAPTVSRNGSAGKEVTVNGSTALINHVIELARKTLSIVETDPAKARRVQAIIDDLTSWRDNIFAESGPSACLVATFNQQLDDKLAEMQDMISNIDMAS